MEQSLFNNGPSRLALEQSIMRKYKNNIPTRIFDAFYSLSKDLVRTLLTIPFDTETRICVPKSTLLQALLCNGDPFQNHRIDLDFMIEVVHALLEKGANPEIRYEYGHTPLMHAARIKSIELMSLLLHYCNINTQDKCGSSALHHAVNHEFIPGIELLVNDPRCIVNIQDMWGCTPLLNVTRSRPNQLSTFNTSKDMLEIQMILLEAGAQQLPSTCEGDTPLHAAVFNLHIHSVYLMLQYNPSLDQKNKEGYTPLDLFPSTLERIVAIYRKDSTMLDKSKKRLTSIISALEKEREKRALRAVFPSTDYPLLHMKQSENRLCSFLCLLDERGASRLPL